MTGKAVMYGGGNIGRGFIGALFAGAGYQVTFVDVVPGVVSGLKSAGQYPVRFVSGQGYEDQIITGVDAVDGNDRERAADLIAGADIMATAVGVGALKHIIPNIVAGIRKRFALTEKPLDIIICENLMDANVIVEGMIKQELTEEERLLFDKRIGLVEASIGRMVPVQTPEMKDGNPLRVSVERYGYLPVDREAFKGVIPDIPQMIPTAPFSFYLRRKLYLHNMGHAICAYLGMYKSYPYIYQSIADQELQLMVKNAMLESVEALSLSYNEPVSPLLRHMEDLLFRFTNEALADTCARVGNDPVRKLGPTDRLVGAARFCLEQGVYPSYIAVGIAAALYKLLDENKKGQSRNGAAEALVSISGLTEQDELTILILDIYSAFLENWGIGAINVMASEKKHAHYGDVV